LDASRLQAGGLSLNRADVSLLVLVERLAERFRIQSKKHTILVDFPENCPVIVADESRLAQVISNLISNAIKYSPEGGEIRVSGQVRPEQVIVCVSDQGPGIGAHDLPHIFDRFYRSTNAVKQTKGAGLGLYLARAIVEAHGGRIWADASTPAPRPDRQSRGAGSSVTDSSRPGQDGAAQQAQPPKPASGARICFSLPR
jgi:signal transduction histidine kinase